MRGPEPETKPPGIEQAPRPPLQPLAPKLPPSPPQQARRAQPVLSEAPVSEMDFAAWQIHLERRHFSCGTIDGDFAMRSRRAVKQFQINRRLPVTGEMDFETRLKLGTPGNVFTQYTVSKEDMDAIAPTPALWKEKARATTLGYNDIWELLEEKFHTTRDFLEKLNSGIAAPLAGTKLQVPNIDPSDPLPKAHRIEILLSETILLAYDKAGLVLACFPCSIAADKNKRPNGNLEVLNKALDPNYTFDPKLLTRIAQEENITEKIILPPGPNNPVGSAWIGLSLPGYGIHGTPEPREISNTGSSGCFRLANWNALKLIRMVEVGTDIKVIP